MDRKFKRSALAAGILGMVGSAHAGMFVDFEYFGPPTDDIDTNPATTVQIDILDPGRIVDLNVEVVIDGGEGSSGTHEETDDYSTGYTDNLTLTLSHTGVDVELYDGAGDTPGVTPCSENGPCDSRDPLVFNAIFDDAAGGPAPTTGSVDSPTNGPYQAVDLLSGFNAQYLAGTWQLAILDPTAFPGDGNDLVSWRIFGRAYVPSPASLALFGVGLAGLGLFRRRRRPATENR